MSYEEFVKILEWFVTPKENNLIQHVRDKDIIVHAIWLTLRNPKFAQQYLDSLPKTTMD